jgi:predicted RNA-binding protein
MNFIKFITITALIIMTSACSYNTYSSGSTIAEPVSYLYFTGSTVGAEVTIDDKPAFIVTKSGNKQQYKVTPGKHIIIVSKHGEVVIKRNVLLGDGHEKEIHIP